MCIQRNKGETRDSRKGKGNTFDMRQLQVLLLALVTVAVLGAAVFCCPRGKVTILMYHHLAEDGETLNSMTVTAGKFRHDMEYLRENNYVTLLPGELSRILRGKEACPERAVVVSFDDGYESNYSIAYPILRETGRRAVISLITENIREAREEGAFMLCWPEVGEMAASGIVEFGSHSDNLHNPDIGGELRKGIDAVNGVQRLHGETYEQYAERVGTDLERSVKKIQDHTGCAVQWFAYPYGAGDRWCEALLKDMGIPISVSTEPGAARVGFGTRDLPRCAVREDTDLAQLLQ